MRTGSHAPSVPALRANDKRFCLRLAARPSRLTVRAQSLPCAGSCRGFSPRHRRFCRRSPESPGFRRNRFCNTARHHSQGVCHPRRTYEPPHPRP
jgi:hypothetical protein